MLPARKISVFPVLYAAVEPRPAAYRNRRDIFFLGGFGHPPNVNAVQWFVEHVWPIVRSKLPRVEFHIIGAEVPDSVARLGQIPGVKVVGFVPELAPVLATLRVGIAPLQYGAGIKGKVAVAMGAGVPCVCTEIAAEGMGIQNDIHALIENDAILFAQAVEKLYTSEETWQRLARNGQDLVRKKFGMEANRTSLLSLLDRARALPLGLYIDYFQRSPLPDVPTPPPGADIAISIIIPVYNKWELTRACLNSIIQTTIGTTLTYEIILADDGSTDATIHANRDHQGLRVIRTSKNLGFLRNCNRAAQEARGRYLLLLNNDTIVLPGWLDALYARIESDDTAAIVGSKLLYPDGTIQEAGAAIFSDGTAMNFGRGFPRDQEIFNILKEVDYISGASILVRRAFWESIGGFDERYANAYCEDSDLAMTARELGLRVIYEPASEVVHFEHQSYATDAAPRVLTLQAENTRLFVNKWQNVLKVDHLPPCDWHAAASRVERSTPNRVRARRLTGKLNILYFSPFPSHPSNHGNQATIQRFAKRFQAMGHNVHFALLESGMYAAEDLQAMRDAWDTLDILPNTHPLGSNGQPIPFDGWYQDGLGERIRLLCARHDIDIVFCSYIFHSKLLEFVPEYILKVIDTHDKMGNRYEMLRTNGQPLEFFSCTPEEEGKYLLRGDLVIARREEERLYFNKVTGTDNCLVVPHIEDPAFVERRFDTLKHVGIVASANRINLSIVKDCLDAIDKQLLHGDCPFIVHVAGQVKDMVTLLSERERDIFNRPWVQLHGFVPDIGHFYRRMDLILSPVTMGTGINVKTVQAMAYGMPLLTTICGIKGIETGDRLHSHEDLHELSVSLFEIERDPKELRRLALLSRSRYALFYEHAMKGFSQIFLQPKLASTALAAAPATHGHPILA